MNTSTTTTTKTLYSLVDPTLGNGAFESTNRLLVEMEQCRMEKETGRVYVIYEEEITQPLPFTEIAKPPKKRYAVLIEKIEEPWTCFQNAYAEGEYSACGRTEEVFLCQYCAVPTCEKEHGYKDQGICVDCDEMDAEGREKVRALQRWLNS